MRMLIGFIIGAVTVGIIVFCLQLVVPAKADVTSQSTFNIANVGQINREALITPLQEAGKTITDKDIASYYHTLLQNCGIPEQ